MADRGEEIENLAVVCRCVADAIGRQHRQLQRIARCGSQPDFATLPRVPGGAAVRRRHFSGRRFRPAVRRLSRASFFAAVQQAAANGPSSPPVRQTRPDAYCCKSSKLAAPSRFRRLPHLELRDELAEILIAGARFAEQRQARRLDGMLMRQPCRRREPRIQSSERQSPLRHARDTLFRFALV